MGTFGLATATTADAIGAERLPQVDTEDLRDQLAEIRDSLDPLLTESGSGLSLSDVEIALTLSASGKVLFIAEGGVEASITLTFSRESAT